MKHASGKRFPPILIIVLTCLFAGMVLRSVADEPVVWRVVKISQLWGDNISNRGLLLYTSGADKTGAAFRCENGRLFAFLAVKPADFRKILQRRSPSPSDRKVRFSLDQGKEVEEKWVQMFSGTIYMVREISTTLELFRAAKNGFVITFTRKYGKTVTVSIPALDHTIAGPFLERCNLKKQYRPDMT